MKADRDRQQIKIQSLQSHIESMKKYGGGGGDRSGISNDSSMMGPGGVLDQTKIIDLEN